MDLEGGCYAQKSARQNAQAGPQRRFFGTRVIVRFTLPLLVIRSYVLEP